MKIRLFLLVAFSCVTSVPAHTQTLQDSTDTGSLLFTSTNQSPVSTSTIQSFSDQATDASHTLATIFSLLTSLLHSSNNQTNVAPSLSALLENVFTLIGQTHGKKSTDLDLFINDLKKDCLNTLIQALDNLSVTPDLDDYKHHATDEEKEAKAQAALCNVATIVNGVANIVQNPHDKINVGQSVGSILAGIINIAMLASHKPH